jgi:uncharacterized membrane protein
MLLALLLACGTDPEPAGACDTAGAAAGPEITWDGWTQGFFLTYCTACHSEATADRRGAPAGVDFDTPTQVLDQESRVRARVLEDRTMPLGGGVPAEDLALLEQWLACPR